MIGKEKFVYPIIFILIELGEFDQNLKILSILDFTGAATNEHAQFSIAFPNSWNLGTVTYQVFWTTEATDTDGVSWMLQGVASSDNTYVNVAYGTAVQVDDDAKGAGKVTTVSAESGALTIAASPADADVCFFRFYRDVSQSNDDMAEDARLIGLKIFYTTDAKNDA